MFIPLYLFADPLISPLYNEVPAVTGPVRTGAGETRRAQSSEAASIVDSVAEDALIDAKPENDAPALVQQNPEEGSSEGLRLYLSVLDSTLQENYPNHYSIGTEESTITVNIWETGLTESAMIMDAADISGWEMFKTGISSMASDFYAGLSDVGIEDKHLIINVLNDNNLNNAILSYMDGVCTYDMMEGQ